MPRWPTTTAEERFFAKTMPEPNSGCLLWLAKVNECGYGTFRHPDTKETLAHRIAFWFANGRFPVDDCLHQCDTTCCVNSDHLYEGTPADNAHDRDVRGRCNSGVRNAEKTECPAGHPYSPENTRMDRSGAGVPCRRCRTCDRIRRSERRAARTPATAHPSH